MRGNGRMRKDRVAVLRASWQTGTMPDLIIPLILFLTPLAWSPGPGNSAFAAIGARAGFRTSIRPLLGYHLATFAVTLVVGLGFADAMSRAPALFELLRYAGSAWVLWMAWRFWRAGAGGPDAAPLHLTITDGALLLVLNPKAWLIIAAMFTQFLDAAPTADTARVLSITTIFTLNNMAAFLGWTLLGDALGRVFRTKARARALNGVFALMLTAVAIWMALGQGV
jgi:threonine/homoserine/homoserine lactone efflux protein